MNNEVSDDYVEAVLTVSTPDHLGLVEQWLQSHNLNAIRIQVGILAQGTRQAFEAAFGVKLQGEQLPVSLPTPAALADAVQSISIPPPRQYHGLAQRGGRHSAGVSWSGEISRS